MKVNAVPRHRWHLFFYALPGGGKTEAASSFPGLVMVSPAKTHDGTLDQNNLDVPFLSPQNEDEWLAIMTSPEVVLDKYVRSQERFKNYEAKTFCFDIVKDFQGLVMGSAKYSAVKDADGTVLIPERPAHGALGRTGNRNDKSVGNELDYRIVDNHLRHLLECIDAMPYHTILTAHADLVGRKKGTDNESQWLTYYPSVEGWALKRDLAGMVGDHLLAFEQQGPKFLCHPTSTPEYFARNRMMKKGMNKSFDWTGKNFFEILEGYKK